MVFGSFTTLRGLISGRLSIHCKLAGDVSVQRTRIYKFNTVLHERHARGGGGGGGGKGMGPKNERKSLTKNCVKTITLSIKKTYT